MSQLTIINNSSDMTLFRDISEMIISARSKMFRFANSALIDLYFSIGEHLCNKIESTKWGSGIVEALAEYLQSSIPEAKGFSSKNLWRMKQFYETYHDVDTKLSSMMREISWTHNLKIMSRCKSFEERAFYIDLSLSERLTVRELDRQISSGLYERSMLDKPILSSKVRELMPQLKESFRDSYVLEFLGAKDFSDEYSMKQAIIAKMKDFLLEVGKDFLFMNQEFRLQVGNEDFRVDLLFYHRELQCLIAFEVKMGRFHPSHLGQLEFYLEALDRDVKKPHENPSIGILLCKDKDDEVVEYAMARTLSPTLVAEYRLNLPDKKLLQDKIRQLFAEGGEIKDVD